MLAVCFYGLGLAGRRPSLVLVIMALPTVTWVHIGLFVIKGAVRSLRFTIVVTFIFQVLAASIQLLGITTQMNPSPLDGNSGSVEDHPEAVSGVLRVLPCWPAVCKQCRSLCFLIADSPQGRAGHHLRGLDLASMIRVRGASGSFVSLDVARSASRLLLPAGRKVDLGKVLQGPSPP